MLSKLDINSITENSNYNMYKYSVIERKIT